MGGITRAFIYCYRHIAAKDEVDVEVYTLSS